MGQQVREVYGASLSPDATAFAHIVDDGGYPRAVQRFLRGWRASSSRDVELPVEGPVSRVVHSADGQWLACEVTLDGSGSRSQIWVVTTDPDDRMAWRIDDEEAGTAELIAWDGTLVAAILTGEDGVGRLLPDRPGRRSSHRAGPSIRRPAGRRLGRGGTDSGGPARLPRNDHAVREDRNRLAPFRSRLHDRRTGSSSTTTNPAASGMDSPASRRSCTTRGTGADGYVRALIRSDNGCEYARLLEVTVTLDGVAYFVVAERPDCDLAEFTVSDDLSTVALLWNLQGAANYRYSNTPITRWASRFRCPGRSRASCPSARAARWSR